uniref:TP53RK-binding protein n=1 Tax=Caligus rogercresseyi TaxID=217165 RepID=C1BRD1_CALRO|nr:TP53RK-binding protein [Caligus rogercresseyi]
MKMDQRWDLNQSGQLQCTLALWKDVQNAPELKKRILSQDIRDVCFINPSLLLDPFCVVVAAKKASEAQLREAMITKSIMTEILFNLSPSKNIRDSLEVYGIRDDSKTLMGLIYLDKNSEAGRLDSLGVKGTRVPLEELESMCDESVIRKKYKASPDITDRASLIKFVTSKIAAKQFI